MIKGPIYLAGPMTGVKGFNYRAFNALAENLRTEGHEVINPAETDGGSFDKPREFYFREAMRVMVGCNSIVLLPGWGNSLGALTEVLVGWQIGCKFYLDTEAGLTPAELPVEVAEVIASAVKQVGGSMTVNRGKHSIRSWQQEPPLRHSLACAVHAIKASMATAERGPDTTRLTDALGLIQDSRIENGFKTRESLSDPDTDNHPQNATCRAAMLAITSKPRG